MTWQIKRITGHARKYDPNTRSTTLEGGSWDVWMMPLVCGHDLGPWRFPTLADAQAARVRAGFREDETMIERVLK